MRTRAGRGQVMYLFMFYFIFIPVIYLFSFINLLLVLYIYIYFFFFWGGAFIAIEEVPTEKGENRQNVVLYTRYQVEGERRK